MPALHLSRFSSLRAFGHRDFVHVWSGALVSNIGTWMETLALGVFVTTVTGRAEATGTIAALTYLPAVVLSPVGGALADRFDRRTYLAVGTVVQSLLAAILTVLAFTGRLTVPAVAVISFLNGCTNTLVNPAFAALISQVVPPEDLHSAVSLNSAQYNLGRIIGPALAAVVLATGGPAWALLVNTLSFLAVLAALSRVRSQGRVGSQTPEDLWPGICRGARVARGDAGISLIMVGTLFVSALVAPFIALVPVFAIRVFNQGAAATSLLVTAQGVGAVCAAMMLGPLVERFGRRRLLEWCLLLIGPVAALYWLAPTLHLAALAIVGLGALYMASLTGLNTSSQLRVPRELQARISSLYSMMIGVGYTVGVWLQGVLADRVGVRFITVTCAVLFLALVLTLRLLRPRAFEATEAPSEFYRPGSPSPSAQLEGPGEF
ncbi:MFS transporter [Vitiosangium sp. GDMCC 1.1324]|uniref:MFS transporter n=1 Tax=Vitiosangium sp. (strain GDMCC 1.1324) TaxID=2138576 RepID=UPI000D3AFBA6|nr:MFS transporter [Vitiosangium sp. GDMCC 1.1324]PTL77100.1 MFS transporter [Vitiosangium sp. GDMCC 1.1324]